MASVDHLVKDALSIFEEICIRNKKREDHAIEEYLAARRIQKCVRGYLTRKHNDLLRKASVIMQKYWRGYVDRQSSLMLIEQYQAELEKQDQKQREEESKEWILYIIFKIHHLIRTKQIKGVYSLPNSTKLSEVEKLLNSLKYIDFIRFYHSYMKDIRKNKTKEPPAYLLEHCPAFARCEKQWLEQSNTDKRSVFAVEPYQTQKQIYKGFNVKQSATSQNKITCKVIKICECVYNKLFSNT